MWICTVINMWQPHQTLSLVNKAGPAVVSSLGTRPAWALSWPPGPTPIKEKSLLFTIKLKGYNFYFELFILYPRWVMRHLSSCKDYLAPQFNLTSNSMWLPQTPSKSRGNIFMPGKRFWPLLVQALAHTLGIVSIRVTNTFKSNWFFEILQKCFSKRGPPSLFGPSRGGLRNLILNKFIWSLLYNLKFENHCFGQLAKTHWSNSARCLFL